MEEDFGKERKEGPQQGEEVAAQPKEVTMNWHHISMNNLAKKKRNIDLYLGKKKKRYQIHIKITTYSRPYVHFQDLR